MLLSASQISPPLGFGGVVQFEGVELGIAAQGEGGGVLGVSADVAVQISGDSAGVFSVQGLETLALMRDPDVPGNGRAWTTVSQQTGSGPIGVAAHEALGVFIDCVVPQGAAIAEASAAAVVVAVGTQTPLMTIQLQASVDVAGRVTVVQEASDVLMEGFLPGETAAINFLFESTLATAVDGQFSLQATPGSSFSSPTIPISIPARTDANPVIVRQALPVSCAASAPPGGGTALFALATTTTADQTAVSLDLTVVERRIVSVSDDIPQPLVLTPGASLTGRITADDSGGFSVIAVTAESVPAGISISISDPFPITSPVVPGGRRLDGVDVTITASAAAIPGFHPFVLNWTVPADGSHRALSGIVQGDIGVVSTPLAPVDLFPPDGTEIHVPNPPLTFRDPGVGTLSEVTDLDYLVTQNGTIVGGDTITGPLSLGATAAPPNLTWPFAIPDGPATLTVVGKNAAGAGPAATSTFTVRSIPNPPAPVPPPPHPGPTTGTLTIQIIMRLPADSQRINVAAWSISGPGAPTTLVPATAAGQTATATVQLPAKPGSYVVQGKAEFSFVGLVQTNGGFSSDSTETQSAPVQLAWTGTNRVALFGLTYDEFSNSFALSFEALLGS